MMRSYFHPTTQRGLCIYFVSSYVNHSTRSSAPQLMPECCAHAFIYLLYSTALLSAEQLEQVASPIINNNTICVLQLTSSLALSPQQRFSPKALCSWKPENSKEAYDSQNPEEKSCRHTLALSDHGIELSCTDMLALRHMRIRLLPLKSIQFFRVTAKGLKCSRLVVRARVAITPFVHLLSNNI